ncbi:c-type cytochrome [Thalassomonas actiniarum]|uniref:Cytochrome c n=1 Tax=Thalassomonas actiniarum TaxID=485447 RepID=A0AAE9YYD5_9GAMM|nr:cytochrome c [Thalassomonas actiniarum]WDE02634.1 cytochrome c [Thalassomonas actiniarum]
MNKWLLFVLTAIALPGYCHAEQPETEQRQQLFQQIEGNTERLEDIIDQQDWQQVSTMALKLEQDVILLKKLFPQSSKGEWRSKEKIWHDWENFEHKLTLWSISFKRIATTSQSKNHRQVIKAFDSATLSCRACHMQYRSLW